MEARPAEVKKSDLPLRLASAVVMLAVAGVALWAGQPWLGWFVLAVVLVAFAEFVRLVVKATANQAYRIAGILAGAVYMGLAALVLLKAPVAMVVGIVGAVVFVDSFAYFTGRALGGPKIAPRISPSKTWAGLLGGIIGATIWIIGWAYIGGHALSGDAPNPFGTGELLRLLALGAATAVAAQSGDFFESWLKRRAGLKDSSKLIPGHGGIFDRIDGMIPVVLLAGFVFGTAAS